MHKIHLTGLVAHCPAAALATFGLYNFLPGCCISFEKNAKDMFAPVLHSEIASVNELATLLSKRDTWNDLLPKQWKEITKVYIDLDIYLKLEDKWKSAIGLNCGKPHVSKKKGKGENGEIVETKIETKIINLTPFYQIFKNSSLRTAINKWISDLGSVGYIENILLNDRWNFQSGYQHLGLFPQLGREEVTVNQEGNINFICLLSLLNWLNFPCVYWKRGVTTAGWVKDKNIWKFRFPVFSRALSRKTFMSWMMDNRLAEETKNKMCLSLGLEQILEFSKKRSVDENNESYEFTWCEII